MSSKIVLKLNRIPRIRAELMPAVSAALERGAYAIERRTKENMAAPKHGRVYRRGTVVHVASAPGESPAIDTGMLANSIRTIRLDALKYAVQAATIYAYALFKGTDRMAARPFLKPEAEELFGQIRTNVMRAIRGAAE
jgi:hypothetical protein